MILDSIPILGHVKGGLHYLVGDFKGGNRAIFEATRSSAVMAGGALGVVGGPVGIAAGAVAAGMVADLLSTVTADSPRGVLGGVIGIATGIANGEVPIESALELSLCLATDIVGGIGGATIVNATKEIGKVIGKNVGKEVVKIVTKTTATHAFARAFTPKSGKSSFNTSDHATTSKKKQSVNVISRGSDSDPPEEKPNTIKKEHYDETDTHWYVFLKIFGVMCLNDIRMGRYNVQIFKDLDDGQRRTLYKLISQLRRHGGTYFVNIINIVKQFFHRFGENEITFQNFISLVQFVMIYVGEKVAKRNDELRYETRDNNLIAFKERQRQLMDDITTEIVKNDSEIYHGTFYDLQVNVWFHLYRTAPSFRNDVSAVYHYYKHRFIPENTNALTMEEYFDLINASLEKLRTLPQFGELSISRREIVYERYMRTFGRRIRTVVKVQGGRLELSSCYFLTVHIVGDKDGDEYVDGKKIRRWIIFLMLHRRKLYYLVALLVCLLSLFLINF